MTTYFISGHIDITGEQFLRHYQGALDEALTAGGCFVVGDSDGVDSFAQQYLSEFKDHVVVFHQGNRPRNYHGRFKLRGGYKSHKEKDEAMTAASDYDIAWVRPLDEQKKIYGDAWRPRKSGTERNLERRQRLNNPDYQMGYFRDALQNSITKERKMDRKQGKRIPRF